VLHREPEEALRSAVDRAQMARAVGPVDRGVVDAPGGVGAADAALRVELGVDRVDRLYVRLAERAAIDEGDLVVDFPEAVVDEEEVPLLPLPLDPHERLFVPIGVLAADARRVVAGGRVLELDEAALERSLLSLAFGFERRLLRA